ncbi:MAG TPA: hypothetical protein VGH16_05765 [Candidatus Binatia bacterium]|jgi:hypothetical protein
MAYLLLLLSGCGISVADLNDRSRRIEREWTFEYQKSEDELRVRVVEAPAIVVYEEVRRTLVDLSLPIVRESFADGLLVAENNAPGFLTKTEWLEVKRKEDPQIKELGGDALALPADSSNFVITFLAVIKEVGDISVVRLDYELDSPQHQRKGLLLSRKAPPTAVRIASQKFWTLLQLRLAKLKIAPPRRRRGKEFEI